MIWSWIYFVIIIIIIIIINIVRTQFAPWKESFLSSKTPT